MLVICGILIDFYFIFFSSFEKNKGLKNVFQIIRRSRTTKSSQLQLMLGKSIRQSSSLQQSFNLPIVQFGTCVVSSSEPSLARRSCNSSTLQSLGLLPSSSSQYDTCSSATSSRFSYTHFQSWHFISFPPCLTLGLDLRSVRWFSPPLTTICDQVRASTLDPRWGFFCSSPFP